MEECSMRRLLLTLAAVAASLTLATTARADDLLVFAAASTKNAVDDIIAAYVAQDGDKVEASYASSSDLAKQIENGAPAGVYISADTKWADYLAERNLIAADGRVDLLGNSIVLVVPKGDSMDVDLAKPDSLAAALGGEWLAMGDPDHVPAGRYGKAALESLGIWTSVEDHLARAKDVRAALALVERGEAAAGIVYATDAAISDEVDVVATFPASSHPEIVYPVMLVAGQDSEAARKFYAFLAGPEARQVFVRYGFTINPAAAPGN
jgi:molybdate transport system substrate-binding protein